MVSKSDGAKLPKTIAGLKIPKVLRKSGALDLLVATPETRRLIADALLAAAKAAADAIMAHRPPETAASQAAAPRELKRTAARRAARRTTKRPPARAPAEDQTAAPSAET